jgi:hypothetical protein
MSAHSRSSPGFSQNSLMRPELRKSTGDVYRLTVSDIERTLGLAARLAASHSEKVERSLATLRSDPSQAAIEIISDEAHYANLDIAYIWTFALWRLQAVFEGIIGQSFLPLTGKPLVGLRRKLSALKEAGFPLDATDEDALFEWAELRNRLSHEPPYFYHGVRLQRADVAEYAELVSRLVVQWSGGEQLPVYHPRLSSE